MSGDAYEHGPRNRPKTTHPDITLIRAPLHVDQGLDPSIRCLAVAVDVRTYDPPDPARPGHAETLRIRADNFDDGLARVATARPAAVPQRYHDARVPPPPVRPEPRYGTVSVALGSDGAYTRVRPHLVPARRAGLVVAHGHQLRTIGAHGRSRSCASTYRAIPYPTFVDVVDHDRSRGPNEFGRRPGRRYRVINREVPHLQEASLRQGSAVRDLQAAQVLLGVVVYHVDAVLLVPIPLGEVGDPRLRIEAVDRIGTDVEKGGILVDAAVVGIADVTVLAGAARTGRIGIDRAHFVFSFCRRCFVNRSQRGGGGGGGGGRAAHRFDFVQHFREGRKYHGK